MKRILPPTIFLLLVLSLWQFLSQYEIISSFLIPSPLQIFSAFAEFSSELQSAFLSTAGNAISGLLISFVFGLLVAILFSFHSLLQRALLPFAIFFQTVPIIAIAPLLVVWFGFGSPTVKASSVIVSFFPILANIMTGLAQSDSGLEEVLRLYKATPFQKLKWLQIPTAIPYILTGLKIAAGLAVVGALVGEFVGGGGLGSLIDSARTQQRLDLVFAAVILSSLLGLLLIAFFNTLSLIILKIRPFGFKHES